MSQPDTLVPDGAPLFLVDELPEGPTVLVTGHEARHAVDVLRLRLGILPLFASQRLFPRLGELRAAHPELHLDIDTAGHGVARLGEGLDAAFERAEAYRRCGVDALFIEALRNEADMDAACARFAPHLPMLANMVEGGKSPVQSAEALGARGFRIVIFPGGTARFVAAQLQRYFASLHSNGTTSPLQGEMLDFDGLNEVIGTPELMARGQRFAA